MIGDALLLLLVMTGIVLLTGVLMVGFTGRERSFLGVGGLVAIGYGLYAQEVVTGPSISPAVVVVPVTAALYMVGRLAARR